MLIQFLYLSIRDKALFWNCLVLSTKCVPCKANSKFVLHAHDVLFLSVTPEVGSVCGGAMDGTGLHIPGKPFCIGV